MTVCRERYQREVRLSMVRILGEAQKLDVCLKRVDEA